MERIPQKLSDALGRVAKELTEGMLTRVKRHPDRADFAAAFERFLTEYSLNGITIVPKQFGNIGTGDDHFHFSGS